MVSLGDLADSWSSVYSNSAVLKSALNFAHFGALLAGGGLAVAADRATLVANREGTDAVRREAIRLGGVHGAVMASFAVLLVSGTLLMLADLDAYLQSPAFWIKMTLVLVLALNGALLRRWGHAAAGGDARAFRTLVTATRVSLGLWFLTTLAGAVLPNAL